MSKSFCYKCMNPLSEGERCNCGFDPAGHMVEPYQLPPGTMLRDRFIIGTILGEGGFGITYIGYDTLFGRKVAIKEFFMSGYVTRTNTTSMQVVTFSGNKKELFENNLEKFLQEGRLLAKYTDVDGIVSILDYFKENGTAYIVMEFVEGETLRSYCKSHGQLSFEAIRSILMPVIDSLATIHKDNIIHRDISPDNIMISKDGKIKLLDFGAAREFEVDHSKSLSVILRPGFAPEEQYRSKGKQGPWTDVYSLCATIYFCMTGRTPTNSLERMADDDLAAICQVVPGCAVGYSDVIMKGMSVYRDGRYQSMEELKAAMLAGFVQKNSAAQDYTVLMGNTKQLDHTLEAGFTQQNGYTEQSNYTQQSSFTQQSNFTQQSDFSQQSGYGQPNSYPQFNGYGQPNVYTGSNGYNGYAQNVGGYSKAPKKGGKIALIGGIAAGITVLLLLSFVFIKSLLDRGSNQANQAKLSPTPTSQAVVLPSQSEVTTEVTQEAATEEVEGEDKVTIRLTRCTFNLGEPDSAQVQKVEDAINEYIDGKINVEIELEDISAGDYSVELWEKIRRDETDLFWTASWYGPDGIGTQNLYEKGYVYDLSDQLVGSKLFDSMPTNVWVAARYNDTSQCFVPIYKDCAEGYSLIVRKDLADRYCYGSDITGVSNWNDFVPFLYDAERDGIKYPFCTQGTAIFSKVAMNRYEFFTQNTESDWIAVDRATNRVVCTVETEDYRDFVSLMSSFGANGFIATEDQVGEYIDIYSNISDIAMTWWQNIPNEEQEIRSRYGEDFYIIPVTLRWVNTVSVLGSCYAVSANCSPEEAKACVDFLGLLYTDSNLADLYTYGILGEDFEYDSEGAVMQYSSLYNHSMWESASVLAVSPAYGNPANMQDMYREFVEFAYSPLTAGFQFDPSPVYPQYKACCEVFRQYGFLLENGVVWPSDVDRYIDEYLNALYEAGLGDILSEFSAQYDAWK